MSAERRVVRPTAGFFDDLDRQLGPERGPSGEPSTNDFQVFELFRIIDLLAPRGSLVFAKGDEAHDVLIVRSGSVKVVVVALNGREVVLDVLDEGAVLVLGHNAFGRLLDTHADMARTIVGVLVTRLRGADRRQLEFGSNDAIGRVCHRLLDLRQRYGRALADGRVRVELPFSQTDLANWAGLSREAVVKGLRSLRSLGWIESDGRSITVIDETTLVTRAAQ